MAPELVIGTTGTLASEEVLMTHVGTCSGRSSTMPEELHRQAEALLVPVPEHASRRIAAARG